MNSRIYSCNLENSLIDLSRAMAHWDDNDIDSDIDYDSPNKKLISCTMDVEEILASVNLYQKYVKCKMKYWAHLIRSDRLLKGHFATFYADLRKYK